ncbi:MAG: GNAT family N-acetyltransferase [Candidatus Saccharimonadales bacterium]
MLTKVPQIEIISFSNTANAPCPEYLEQSLEVFGEALPNVPPTIIRSAAQRQGAVGFVALGDTGVAHGAAILSLNTRPYKGTSEACLEYLGVIKTERQNGLGTKLMIAVEGTCSGAGKQILSLQSSSARAALRLYTRRGFSMYDPMKREMVKRLGNR